MAAARPASTTPSIARAGSLAVEFRDFILRGNVVDLAVGIIIGVAFGNVVGALVKDIITPIIGIFGGTPDFSAVHFTINNSTFLIGDFINVVITFLVIAAVVFFFVVKPVNGLMARFKPTPEPPAATQDCPYCMSSIPAGATRCAFCTSELAPGVQA
jgi:large conductance mechanosensitive channel